MKLNKIIIISLFLLLLISLGSISAYEDVSGEISSDSVDAIEMDDINSKDPIQLSDNENSQSFSDLNNYINNTIAESDEINISNNYEFNEMEDSQLINGIYIDGNLIKNADKTFTIYGNNKTIDAKSNARIFKVVNGANLIIENLNFINGQSSASGGAINVENGSLTIKNSRFEGNNVSESGAAIYSNEAVTIIDSSFSNNIAAMNGIISSLNLIIRNSAFANNIAEEDGVISSKNVNILDSSFNNNTARGIHGGGAVRGTNVEISNSSFEYNSASSSGGAILATTAIISDSYFNENTAFYGGAISGANISISNSILNSNSAEYGGAIYASSIYVSNSSFINNTANYGGAVYGFKINDSYMCIQCTYFIDNEAKTNGSAIFIEDNGTIVLGSDRFNDKISEEIKDIGYFNMPIIVEAVEDSAVNSTINQSTVKPKPVSTKISASKVTANYNVAKKLVITLKDNKGKALAKKKVHVTVGSISKTLTTNAKGQVSVLVSSLVPKTYTAKFSFAGDKNYSKSSSSVKVTVKKSSPKIAASKKTFKRKAKTKTYTVSLKDNTGKVMKNTKLSLKVNGKTYTVKTNKYGKASFKIKLYKKGSFKAVITYAGNKYYNKVTKTVYIKIKK